MLAAITDGKGNVYPGEVPLPVPGDYECLCRIEACASCTGTDKKLITGEMSWAKPEGYPALLGHESVGTVIKTGAKVRNIRPGARFLRPCAWYSGTVKHGITSWMGGFAEFGIITDTAAFTEDHPGTALPGYSIFQQEIPADVEISSVDATMLITLKEICSFIRNLQITAGNKVLILGAGCVGIAMCFFAKLAGAQAAVAARRESQLAAALKAGADLVVNSADPSAVEKIRNWSSSGADHLLDAAGSVALLNQFLPALDNNAAVCPYASNPEIRDKFTVSGNLRLLKCRPAEETAHEELLALVRKKSIPFQLFYTEVLPLEEISSGFERLFSKKSDKTVFTMNHQQ